MGAVFCNNHGDAIAAFVSDEIAEAMEIENWPPLEERLAIIQSSTSKPRRSPCCPMCFKRWARGLQIHPATSSRPCTFKECGPRVDPKTISAFEEGYKLRFPHDYKEWLVGFNGGRPERSTFLFDDPDAEPIKVAILFGAEERPKDQLIPDNLERGQEA